MNQTQRNSPESSGIIKTIMTFNYTSCLAANGQSPSLRATGVCSAAPPQVSSSHAPSTAVRIIIIANDKETELAGMKTRLWT